MNLPVRCPIILAHGIARFDYITHSLLKKIQALFLSAEIKLNRFHYFSGISTYLNQQGYKAFNTEVSFAADVTKRAEELRNQILGILKMTGEEKAHVIAHSMGGLDARWMIASYKDMPNKISTLTTIGTPHLGTIFADWILKNGLDKIIRMIEGLVDLKGYRNLTTEACGDFNSRIEPLEASNSVVYQVIASCQEKERIFIPFQKSWEIIFNEEGDNDGLVSAKSQLWKDQLKGENGVIKKIIQKKFPIPADHFGTIGWWNPNQFEGKGWWNFKNFKKKKEFEERIQEIYLDIVQGLGQFEMTHQPS